MKFAGRGFATLAFLVLAGMPAWADPVMLLGGRVDVQINSGLATGTLTGDGFRMTFGADSFDSALAPDCVPCLPGATTSLGGTFRLPRAGGTAEVDGVFYPLLHFDGMAGTFSSPPVVISGTSTLTVTQPFSFSGEVAGYLLDPFDHGTLTPEFTRTLLGQGRATATFVYATDDAGGRYFTASDLRYEFGDAAPVPEPATLLLVGAGLAGAVRARRRPR